MNATTRIVRRGDAEWPFTELHHIPDPPLELFMKGRPLRSGNEAVAVVGSRRPTAAGIDAARTITKGLVQAGFAVVSGLAMGIDSVAHRAALESGGVTVAVMGCGLDSVYPKKNESLKARIEVSGTVVSEYPDGTDPAPWHFPERNRIIAGISSAVVIVEGSLKSGALITARCALDYNRDVFAIPGSIRNPMAEGPNMLIRTAQAKLVTEVTHITDELAPGLIYQGTNSRECHQVALEESELAVLYLLDDAPIRSELVCRETGMSVGEAAINLSRLEVRNFVRKTRAGYELTEAGARARASLAI